MSDTIPEPTPEQLLNAALTTLTAAYNTALRTKVGLEATATLIRTHVRTGYQDDEQARMADALDLLAAGQEQLELALTALVTAVKVTR